MTKALPGLGRSKASRRKTLRETKVDQLQIGLLDGCTLDVVRDFSPEKLGKGPTTHTPWLWCTQPPKTPETKKVFFCWWKHVRNCSTSLDVLPTCS